MGVAGPNDEFQFGQVLEKTEKQLPAKLLEKLARMMLESRNPPATNPPPESDIPAGYTYLAQFVAHDLSFDKTSVAPGHRFSTAEMVQGRSPILDLDCLYGAGPEVCPAYYQADHATLKIGATTRRTDLGVGQDVASLPGYDLPRYADGLANIPDPRNDENLVVAQLHCAFIRFHNKAVQKYRDFAAARRQTVLHYQWLLLSDLLPKIVDSEILRDVFERGRRRFLRNQPSGPFTQMPVEFTHAAFRLGHSMVRRAYAWNIWFELQTVHELMQLTGRMGLALKGQDPGVSLPSPWAPDFRHWFDFSSERVLNRWSTLRGFSDSKKVNRASRIDTNIEALLGDLPLESLRDLDRGNNLAQRTLQRGADLGLRSGQEYAKHMGLKALDRKAIIEGSDGVDLGTIPHDEQEHIARNTPLWFYVLREAELNGGLMTGVGGHIVAEVIHAAMAGSTDSIVEEPGWKPELGAAGKFYVEDFLMSPLDEPREGLSPLHFH